MYSQSALLNRCHAEPVHTWTLRIALLQIAAPHSTALFTASVRLIPAGAAVIAWAAWKQKPWPSSAQAWVAISVFGLVDGTLFQGFLAEGLQRVPAGIGSVLIDSQPLTVAVVAAILFGESLSLAGIFGLVLGIGGLLFLEVPLDTLNSWAHLDFSTLLLRCNEHRDALHVLFAQPFPCMCCMGIWDYLYDCSHACLTSMRHCMPLALCSSCTVCAGSTLHQPGADWLTSGPALMLAAAQCMAAGTLMVPWVTKFADPIMATGWHMLLGGVPLVAYSAATERQELFSNLPQMNAGVKHGCVACSAVRDISFQAVVPEPEGSLACVMQA